MSLRLSLLLIRRTFRGPEESQRDKRNEQGKEHKPATGKRRLHGLTPERLCQAVEPALSGIDLTAVVCPYLDVCLYCSRQFRGSPPPPPKRTEVAADTVD